MSGERIGDNLMACLLVGPANQRGEGGNGSFLFPRVLRDPGLLLAGPLRGHSFNLIKESFLRKSRIPASRKAGSFSDLKSRTSPQTPRLRREEFGAAIPETLNLKP
ncbi:MAG: hypothetical protein V2I46_06000 [Bacteroides sp.]|nr:hypothetical protein [Bacteroides sp.]